MSYPDAPHPLNELKLYKEKMILSLYNQQQQYIQCLKNYIKELETIIEENNILKG